MLDALFMSTCTLNVLFVLIKCTIPLIFHIIVRQIYEVSQAGSIVTVDHKASVTRTCYCCYSNLIVYAYTSHTQCA